MIDAKQLEEAIARLTLVTPYEGVVRVATQCLYPSNSSVSVAVRGGDDAFVVSDEGGAVGEVGSSGMHDRPTDRQIRAIVAPQGLKVSDGVIYSPAVDRDAVPVAIMLVANIAKEVADWSLAHMRFTTPRNFRKDLTDLLQRHFHDNLKNDLPILGASNKPHKFGHVIYLEDGRRLLVDPVINDSSSINARVVANLDVRMAKNTKTDQMIVYDDRLSWSSSDLTLLQVGAPIVPFSDADGVLQKLAA